MAICLSILRAEAESRFREQVEKAECDWYLYLYNRLTREATRPEDSSRFGGNPISFVTFNYDRSLEYYFSNCIQYSFEGMDNQKAGAELGRRPIIHVYGRPCLPQSPERGEEQMLPYGKDIGERLPCVDLLGMIESIYVVHDERKNPELEEARKEIAKAARIFFLGFGYAKENVEALGFPDVLNAGHQIYGTAMGRTPREIKDIEQTFLAGLTDSGASHLTAHTQIHIRDWDWVELLRDFP